MYNLFESNHPSSCNHSLNSFKFLQIVKWLELRTRQEKSYRRENDFGMFSDLHC